MFKHSYVRGVQNALIQGGHVEFPDGDSALKVADYIADNLNFDPVAGAVTFEATAKVAEALIDASGWFRQQPGFKAASFQKLATVEDLGTLAHAHALDLMDKAAEATSAEGQMDAMERPPGYAEGAQGTTEVNTSPGAVGIEQPHPSGPSNSPMGTNSAVEQARTASLHTLIAKLAEGSTILGGDKGNSTPSSAEGKMDATQRPTGYAVLPHQGALGAMMEQFRGPAVIGRETPHPSGPANSPAGSNSLTQHSAKAAAEDPYVYLFKKTAAEIVGYLPGALHESAKIAHVRACMGMTTEEKAHYLVGLQKEAADKTAPTTAARARKAYNGRTANQKLSADEALPPFIQKKIDEREDEDKDEDKDEDGGMKVDANDEEKKEEAKAEEKKEGSLRAHFRRISSSTQPRV